jgi:hypothetical protein
MPIAPSSAPGRATIAAWVSAAILATVTATSLLVGTGGITLTEASAPATPASGLVAVYAKTDGKVYRKDDAGTEAELAGSTSASDLTSGTLAVARGGTGVGNTDAYMPVLGGTTSTGAFRSVGASGSAGNTLKFNSTSSNPTWGALNIGGGTEYVTGTLPVGHGGIGISTAGANTYGPVFAGTTATGAFQVGSVGTSGHVLTSNGAGALPTFQAASGGSLDYSTKVELIEEYVGDFSLASSTVPVGCLGLSGIKGNTGTTAHSSESGSSNGRVRLSTQSNASGYAGVRGPVNGTNLTTGVLTLEHRVRLYNGLSDGTDTYSVRIGATNSSDGTAASNEVCFTYTHSVNSGNWTAVSRDGGSETATNTAVAVANDTETVLKIVCNQPANTCAFYINGNLVATHTTNLPYYSTPGVFIAKSVGTDARILDTEYTYYKFVFTTPR